MTDIEVAEVAAPDYWATAKRDKLVVPVLTALRHWRNEDHEEVIVLNRDQVCHLLDEIERLEKQSKEPSHD